MQSACPQAMAFLLARRSRPAKLLGPPVPDEAQLDLLLTAAARVPDHGKLTPWRFVVLTRPALVRLGAAVAAHGAATGRGPEDIAKAAGVYSNAHLVVAVIASPKPSDKVPVIEQTLSTGAVCLSLVNAALASGWGACWLSGWASHDTSFIAPALGLSEGEGVAGMIHLGTATATPPERPRPDIAALTQWVRA